MRVLGHKLKFVHIGYNGDVWEETDPRNVYDNVIIDPFTKALSNIMTMTGQILLHQVTSCS